MATIEILHHPFVESVFLPLLLAVGGVPMLRAVTGPSRAAAAIGLAFVASVIWMVGWSPRPAGVMQRLPWIFAVAWLVGVALDARIAGRWLQWLALSAVWLVSSWWLGTKGLLQTSALAVAGVVVIGLLLRGPDDRADRAAMTIVASLGLAALAFNAGSLALLQLGVTLAAAMAGAALWMWPTPRIRFGAAAVAVGAIGWLALAQTVLLLLPAQPQAVALLGLAFAAAIVCTPMIARLAPPARRVAAPLAVAMLAAVCVVGALMLQTDGAVHRAGEQSSPGPDDAYYPR